MVDINNPIVSDNLRHLDIRVLRLRLDLLVLHIDRVRGRHLVALSCRTLVSEEHLLVFQSLYLLLSLLLQSLNLLFRNAKEHAHVLDLLIIHVSNLELLLEALFLPLQLGDHSLLLFLFVVLLIALLLVDGFGLLVLLLHILLKSPSINDLSLSFFPLALQKRVTLLIYNVLRLVDEAPLRLSSISE